MSRDFFCDARNVGAQAASLERAARGEAVRRPDSKDVALRGLGPRPLRDEGDHFVWDRGINQTAPRLGSTESSTSPDEAEDDETGTLREESITPSRAAAVDASRGLTFLRRSKVRASTQHAVDSRVADFLQWSEERENVRDVPWALLGAVFREESWSWLVMRRRHRRQPTTTCLPRFRKLVMADCDGAGWVPDQIARISGVVGMQCFASPATRSRCAQTRWSVAGAAHSIVGLCCCTPQSSKSEAACGNDTDSPSWPVNVLLDRQARDCGVSAGPTCRDRSPKAAEGAEGVERFQWQNFKQFRRHWRVEPS